jgi:hypothetical protein
MEPCTRRETILQAGVMNAAPTGGFVSRQHYEAQPEETTLLPVWVCCGTIGMKM